jgi:NRAMP (natural resistance-associated macrophage protein)-like metal ion transporter
MNFKRFSLGKFVEFFARIPTRSRRRLLAYSPLAFISILGPGLIAASAGNEASGIATYSFAGANFGYTLLWAFIPMTFFFILAQEMCIRMGVVTGQGLSDLIRENFGVRWTAFVMLALVVANSGIVIAQFVGIAQASELLGVPRYITVPVAALGIWWLVVRGTPKRIEQIFLLMSLIFVTYIVAAFAAKPDWVEIGSSFVKPTLSFEPGFLFTLTALIGTTITPFMPIFLQSSVVEKGLGAEDLGKSRADAIFGVVFANIVALFIVIATAGTVHHKSLGLNETSDLAQAFLPVFGEYAKYVFAVGLLGASMLAMGVLPIATAYSVTEALGFEKGLSRSFREAPIFLGMFTALIVIGAVVALIPQIDQIRLLVMTQFVNGLLLPILLAAIVLLSSNRELMGEHVNGRLHKTVAWLMTLILGTLSAVLIARGLIEMLGS